MFATPKTGGTETPDRFLDIPAFGRYWEPSLPPALKREWEFDRLRGLNNDYLLAP